jgi:hypothetical protein
MRIAIGSSCCANIRCRRRFRLQSEESVMTSEQTCSPRPTFQLPAAISIQIAETPAQLEAAYCLRYGVYVEELKFSQPFADHDAQTVIDPLDATAIILVATMANEVIGTVRSNFGFNSDFGRFASLHGMEKLGAVYPARVSLTSKMIVDKRYRSRTVSLALANAIFQIGASQGIAVDFIDCEPKLVPLYRRLGYELTTDEPFDHPELGPRMSLRLWVDSDYLARVRSPFLRHLS